MARYTLTFPAEYENGQVVIDEDILVFKNKNDLIGYLLNARFADASLTKE